MIKKYSTIHESKLIAIFFFKRKMKISYLLKSMAVNCSNMNILRFTKLNIYDEINFTNAIELILINF